jgi:hypothetical protein
MLIASAHRTPLVGFSCAPHDTSRFRMLHKARRHL